MLEEAHSLPDDIAALRAMVLASQAELAARDAELHNRDLLIEKLKHQLAGLRRQRFGAGSEALDQLELGIEDEEIARAAETLPEPPAATKKQPKRRPLPDHLPREETILTPSERCADCGGRLKPLVEDVTEELEYISGRHVLAGQALFADDMPVKLLAPGTGKTATGRAWTNVRDERPWNGEAPPASGYRFSADRKAAHPKEHLAGFTGWMHSDGYAGFGALARAGPAREVACLAHIRRGPAPDLIRGSSTSMPPRARRSSPRRWNGSPPSTPSRRKPAASRPNAAQPFAGPGPRRASTRSSAGCNRNCRRSPPRPRWRRRSAMR